MIELSETSTSSDKPLFPKTPSKGAIIFSDLSLAIRSPFFTCWLKSIGVSRSDFFSLKDFVLLGRAVPKVSNFCEKL